MATFSIPPAHIEFRRSGPWKVAVVAGGDSAEREVSLASGACVTRALREQGHHVVEIDPLVVNLSRHDWSQIDVAFLALHGKYGEDGQVQGILELLGVPYTGSDVEASRIGISKSATKERMSQQGVPTAPYVLIHESDAPDRILAQANSLGFPLVIKPDTQGSSLGVSIVQSAAELLAAIPKTFALDTFGILERAIVGSEWTVGILDDCILPPIQIATDRQFFDFHAKYQDDATGYRFEFDVTSDVVRRVELAAQNACRAVGTRGLARVDIMLDRQLQPWVLEVNTIPGLTDHSLVPKAAARLGWSFGELCERAIFSSLKNPTLATRRITDRAS